jgi:biopolymer transport protein ExbD
LVQAPQEKPAPTVLKDVKETLNDGRPERLDLKRRVGTSAASRVSNLSARSNPTGSHGEAGPYKENLAMSMTLGAHKNASSEMNVTSLIDVLLVLLIIFMVLPHHRGEKAEIPQTTTAPANPDDPIVIQLLDSGSGRPPSLKINHQVVAVDALEKRLTEIFQNRIEKTAFLKGDPEVDFQYVAEVMDTARRAGVGRVGLLGEREGSVQPNP